MTSLAGAAAPDATVDAIGARRALVRERARRSLTRRRTTSRVAVVACVVAVGVSLAPLVALVTYTVARGTHVLSTAFLTHDPTPPGIPGGGVSDAIVGSLIIVGLGAVIAVPVGLVTALFLLERGGRIANALRMAADVLTGVPSIAIGIFAYALLVAPGGVISLGHFSGLAGSLALAILMLPIVIRSSEAAMRAVPRDHWEAGLALGVRRSRVVRSVVLRGALPGLVTGNLLAVARAVGETAPLLFTAIGSQLFSTNPLQAMAAMPLVIFNDGTQAYPAAQEIAWGTALVLLTLVLVLSVVARVVAARLNRQAR
ncbi:MAG: phosphate ABC transporter permease PstA [Acidimicrobiales bacterium]